MPPDYFICPDDHLLSEDGSAGISVRSNTRTQDVDAKGLQNIVRKGMTTALIGISSIDDLQSKLQNPKTPGSDWHVRHDDLSDSAKKKAVVQGIRDAIIASGQFNDDVERAVGVVLEAVELRIARKKAMLDVLDPNREAGTKIREILDPTWKPETFQARLLRTITAMIRTLNPEISGAMLRPHAQDLIRHIVESINDARLTGSGHTDEELTALRDQYPTLPPIEDGQSSQRHKALSDPTAIANDLINFIITLLINGTLDINNRSSSTYEGTVSVTALQLESHLDARNRTTDR